jgi:O-antigen ligase
MKKITVDSTWFSLVSIFLILMMTIPTSFQKERLVFLIIILLGVLVSMPFKGWRMDKIIFTLFSLNIILGLSFSLYGLVNDTPGAVDLIRVYVIWPLLYFYISGIQIKSDNVQLLPVIILIGVALTAVMGLYVVYNFFYGGGNDSINYFWISQGYGTGLQGEIFEYNLWNIPTLIYGIGFLTTYTLIQDNTFKNNHPMVIYFIYFIVVVVATLSGRKVLWLTILYSPLLSFILLRLSKVRVNFKVILFYLSIYASGFYLFLTYSDFLLEGSIVDHARIEQFHFLFNSWADNPFFGHGSGATVGLHRSPDQPWSYELFYLALLFQLGILGVSVYLISIVILIFLAIKIVRKDSNSSTILIPMISGMICFLIASGTNPYLGKFDSLYVIFVLVYSVNAFTVKRPY